MSDILDKLRLDRELNFVSILNQEIKSAKLYKMRVTNVFEVKTDLIQKHGQLMDKVLCGIIRSTQILFCVHKMILSKDRFLGDLPQSALSVINSFLHRSQNSFLGSTSSYSPSTAEILLAFADIIERVRELKLWDHVLEYTDQMSDIQKKVLSDLQAFRARIHSRTTDLIASNFFNTKYIQNLKHLDKVNVTRINELQTEHNLIVDRYKAVKKFHDHTINTAKLKDRMVQDYHKNDLERERIKNDTIVIKMLKVITEEKSNRATSFESLKRLYCSTLEKDQKQWRHLKETRYKREAAVQSAIDRYDRDYGTEYRRYEDLSSQLKVLTTRSNKLEQDTRAQDHRFFLVHQCIEAEIDAFKSKRNDKCARKIQKWWHQILSERMRRRILFSSRSHSTFTKSNDSLQEQDKKAKVARKSMRKSISIVPITPKPKKSISLTPRQSTKQSKSPIRKKSTK